MGIIGKALLASRHKLGGVLFLQTQLGFISFVALFYTVTTTRRKKEKLDYLLVATLPKRCGNLFVIYLLSLSSTIVLRKFNRNSLMKLLVRALN